MVGVSRRARMAVALVAVLAGVLAPCLCVAFPPKATENHGCCPEKEGLRPVPTDCCVCAVTPVPDTTTSSAAGQGPAWETAWSPVPRTPPAAAPAAAVTHIPSPPPALRV